MQLHEFAEAEAFYSGLLQKFQALAQSAVASRQECNVALSGGKTPAPFYQKLNQTSDLPWNQLFWFVGDERWVSPEDDLCNEKMIRKSLGVNRPEFAQNFFSWLVVGEPELAAKMYQEKLFSTVGEPPVFDLILLGVGEDGHTASLFPGTAGLEETQRYAIVNQVPHAPHSPTRLTFTYPTLNAAREVWFLVNGKEKGSMIERLLNRDATIPSARVQNANQHLFWLK